MADLRVEEGFTEEELHASAVTVESAAKFINTKAFLQSFMHLTLFRTALVLFVAGREENSYHHSSRLGSTKKSDKNLRIFDCFPSILCWNAF